MASSTTSIPTSRANSMASSRVMPARHPLSSGGVRTTPSATAKMLLPVPSQSSPRVLAKIASVPPFSLAWASAMTFSA